MLKLRELKELIIKNEIEFIEQVQQEDPKMYIDGITDEINMCENIDDIVSFYGYHGYKLEEAYRIVINLLMENSSK